MQANRRRDTVPELRLRRLLHADGLRYRVDHPIRLDGVPRAVRPDIAFTRARLAVFVDGCFWHGCPDHAWYPRSNLDYWRPKLAGNARRDRVQTAALEAERWTVLRCWEHEDPHLMADRVRIALIDAARREATCR